MANKNRTVKLKYLISFLVVGDLAFSKDINHLDLNRDGKQDVWYEVESGKEYELIDSNFDGKIDVSNLLDKHGGIVLTRYDQDFNGSLESTDYFESGRLTKTLVRDDSLKDINIIFFYLENSFSCAVKLLDRGSNVMTVERVLFDFNYPSKVDKFEISEDKDESIEHALERFCTEYI